MSSGNIKSSFSLELIGFHGGFWKKKYPVLILLNSEKKAQGRPLVLSKIGDSVTIDHTLTIR